MRAAIWVRISEEREGDVTNQMLQIQRWAEQRELTIVKTYEVGVSAFRGAHLKALSNVYDDAAHGDFDVLLVWALDRLSRQGPAAILGIVERLENMNVKVWSYQESWLEDAGASHRELLLSIAGWIAKQESQRHSERVKAGMERAAAGGTKIGRPKGKTDSKKRTRRPS